MSTYHDDQRIREHLHHGEGTMRVTIHRDGRVSSTGSRDDTDRDHDWRAARGNRDDILREIARDEAEYGWEVEA